MPNFNILSEAFFNQFNNGLNLDLNPSDTTPNLVGNGSDKMKTLQKVSVSWVSVTDVVSPFTIKTSQSLRRASGSFILDGFAVGDVISLRNIGTSAWVFEDRIIDIVTAISITFQGAAVTLQTISDAKLYGKTDQTTLHYGYGIIENSESPNTTSKIDGTVQNSYTATGIGIDSGGGRATTFVPLIPYNIGVNSWKVGNEDLSKVRYIETLDFEDDYAQVFEIEHVFSILPYFLDGELSNIQTLLPPYLFQGTNSLKYIYTAIFNASLTNPNGIKPAFSFGNLGSVGYIGQSLNGGVVNYATNTVTYIDLSTTLAASGLNALVKTRVNFNLSSAALFVAGTNVSIAVSLLPPASQYEQNQNTIDENFLLDRAFTVVDSAAIASSLISNYTAVKNSDSEIAVQFDVDYSGVDNTVLQNQNYVILVSTSDVSLSSSNTDRALLKVDTQAYLYDTDVEDLVLISEIPHFPHDVDIADVSKAFDNNVGWIEDGFVINPIIQVNNDLNAKISSLKGSMSAYNPTTGDRFDLQTIYLNLTAGVILNIPPFNPVKAYNSIKSRNFKLIEGSQFNKVSLTSIGFALNGGINVYEYNMVMAFKANFEEWLAQPGANTFFYDINEPNDGLNKKSSRYSLKEGYEIVVIIDLVMQKDSTRTNYEFISQPHEYHDYDEDGDTPANYTGEITIYDSFGYDTSGIINVNEVSKIKAVFTPDSGTTDLLNPYAIVRMVPVGGNINTIYELSSIEGSVTDNLLIPLTGESYTKIVDNGLTVEVECNIDGIKLDDQTGYLITVEFRESTADMGITTELGVLIATETSDIIIIE